MVSHDGDRAVAFGDDPPGATGAPRHLGDVWFAFSLVRIEQRLRSLPFQHGGELPAQVGGVANTGRHSLTDPRRHRVRGIAGQEDPAYPPSVGDADVVAVDHGAQNLDVLLGDALIVQHLPNRVVVEQLLLEFACARRVFPAVVAQGSRTVDGRAGRIAVKAQPVVAFPLPQHLGVDDDPALAVGPPGVADAELAPGRRRAAVGGDDIAGVQALQRVGPQVGEHQLDAVVVGMYAQAFVFQQYVNVGKSLDAVPQDMVDRWLIQKLLRWMPCAARVDLQVDERHIVGVDKGQRPVGQHVAL